MLWSRSASLMSTTRMSSAIARNIFRMFSACCCSWLSVENLLSLVTPSTSCATSLPKRSSMSERAYSVSSGTSCSSSAWTAVRSMPRPARICAAAIGCVTNGSPEARFASPWASIANSIARRTSVTSASGSCEDRRDERLAHRLRRVLPRRARGVAATAAIGFSVAALPFARRCSWRRALLGGGGAFRRGAIRLRVPFALAALAFDRRSGWRRDQCRSGARREAVRAGRAAGTVLGGPLGPRTRGHHRA